MAIFFAVQHATPNGGSTEFAGFATCEMESNGDMNTWDGERSGVEGMRVSVCHGGETMLGQAKIHQLSIEEKSIVILSLL